jgi:hypothetical protein
MHLFGMDGEKAINNAFNEVFPAIQILNCASHFEKNIEQKVMELGITREKWKKMRSSITGAENSYGLLDAVDSDDLKNQYKHALIIWKAVINDDTKFEKFRLYFENNIYSKVEKYMTQKLLQSVGVASSRYRTHGSESMNNKVQSSYAGSSLYDSIKHLVEFLIVQLKDVFRSYLGIGPYQLKPEKKRITMSQSEKLLDNFPEKDAIINGIDVSELPE